MGAARSIKEEGKMPLSLGTGHLAFLMENAFSDGLYCAAVRRHSTSKHGIVISQYQNALVRVNPKTLLLQIVWLLISDLKREYILNSDSCILCHNRAAQYEQACHFAVMPAKRPCQGVP